MAQVKQREKSDSYLDGRVRELERERLRKILPFVLSSVAGFCMSKVDVLGSLSPFASALIAVVPYKYCAGVFLGGTVGYLSAFSVEFTVKYVLCLCFICFARLLVHKRIKRLEEGFFLCTISFLTVMTGSVIQNLYGGIGFTEILLALLEGAIAFSGGYFFKRSFSAPVKRMGLYNLPAGDRVCLGVSIFIFVVCASGVNVEGFSPVRFLCFIAVCFASYCKGIPVGSATGVCLGAALSVAPESRFIFPAFAMGGFISGVFAPIGQVALGASACISFCISCVAGGFDDKLILPMIECGAASAVFMLIPPVWLSRGAEWVKKSAVISDDCVNLQVSAILKRASANILSFCKTVDEVSERLDRVINPEVNKLFFEIQQKVCDGCGKKAACWSSNFDTTAQEVLVIMGIEKRGKSRLQIEKNCERFNELRKQVNKGRSQYSLSMLAKNKNREMRRILTEQFFGMGDFLSELSDKITKSRTVDTVKSMALRSVIIDAGVYIDALSCYCCDEGRLSIEISCFERPVEDDYIKIKNILEESTDRFFEEPEINITEMGVFIKYEETPPFYLITGTAQRPFDKEAPCGDSVAFCKRSDASSAVLLSDGMGTGASAALDSTMAVTLMEKLLSGGFSFETGVKLVNSSLIMKSTDESMATMDGFCVNLYTGEAKFYKAGAAISFIRSDREIFVVEESSLPLGILREASFAVTPVNLSPGDIVLLVSDGITAGDCGWINDELLSWSTNNMDDLAGHIVQLAALRQERFTGDDLTAVAVKISDRGVSLI